MDAYDFFWQKYKYIMWPVMSLGGSNVSIKENFKVKGKCANRVVSQDSGGFVKFLYFLPVARGITIYFFFISDQIFTLCRFCLF
jgi:hypothetical protein